MANFQYVTDILNDALFRAHEPTDGTSDLNTQALVYLNRAHRSLCLGGAELVPGMNEDWWWLRGESNLILEPALTTGTVTLTNNSNAVIFSSITTMSLYIGWYFQVDNHPDVFKITTGTTSDDGVLDSVYTGSTASAGTFKLMHLEYDLAATARKLISPMNVNQGGRTQIYQTTLDRMQQMHPISQIQQGVPEHFAPVDENTVRFSHYVSLTSGTYVRADYDYVMLATDLLASTASITEPLVPLHYRQILADWTLYFLMVDKDEANSEGIGLQAKAGIISMQKENRVRWVQTGKQGQIEPRQRQVSRNLIRTRSGIIIG